MESGIKQWEKAMPKILRTLFAIFVLTGLLYNAMAQEEKDKDEVKTTRKESREELSTVIGDGGVHHIYTDPKKLFRLSPPRGWKIDENPGEGINVKFIAPDNPDVEISIKVTRSKEDFEKIKENLKNKNKEVLKEYQLLSEEKYVIDGEKGYMVCSEVSPPAKWKSKTKCSEVIYIKGDKLIYFKYIAPSDEYDRYFSVFRGRLMTFESL